MAFNSIPQYDGSVAGNNTDVGGISIAEGYPAGNINNAMRQMLLQLKQYLANSATVASASTVDLGAQTANYLTISGSTTINSFGTVAAGTWRMIRFSGAVPITYNATSMILPGAVSKTAAAGDTALFVSEGSGNWRCHSYVNASGLPIVNPTVAPSPSSINGLLPSSIAGTSTTASLTVSAGTAADSTNASLLTLGSQAWAVSNGNAINGYQGGTTLPNSSTIHMFVCNGASGTGTFASTSLTPTLPTGYTTYSRRIFSFNTTGAGAPIPYTAIEVEGGAMLAYLTTQVLDANSTTLGASRTLFTLSVPTGYRVQPIFRASGQTVSSAIIITSPDETDVAPSNAGTTFTSAPGSDLAAAASNSVSGYFQGFTTTNTSGQIGARADAANRGFNVVTRGWKDWRR